MIIIGMLTHMSTIKTSFFRDGRAIESNNNNHNLRSIFELGYQINVEHIANQFRNLNPVNC